MTNAETLAAQVQAARDKVRESGKRKDLAGSSIKYPWLQAADRYAYLVGLQQQRESVVRIGCQTNPSGGYVCGWEGGEPCDRCRELRRIDAEIAEAG